MKRFLFFILVTTKLFCGTSEKPFVVIIPSYKNEKWVEWNLNSILSQRYTNFRIIYIDDLSPDKTFNRAQEIVQESKKQVPIQLIRNKTRKGAMQNLYDAIHSCKDEEIIVTVDGDDWLPHKHVLAYLNFIYSENDVWLTHGTYLDTKGGLGCDGPVSDDVIKNNAFRGSCRPSHLRTFYTWLFKKIKKEDLMYEGQYMDMTWDLAMMFPMMEMAGQRQTFISEVLYIYNTENPINDFKKDLSRQHMLDDYIHGLPRYSLLNNR